MNLGDIFADLFAQRDKDGRAIQFSLKPGQSMYRFYRGPGGEQYCFTPHPDTQGRFWSWVYKPFGSGRRKFWKIVELRQRRSREAAKRDARQRLEDARQRAQKSKAKKAAADAQAGEQ